MKIRDFSGQYYNFTGGFSGGLIPKTAVVNSVSWILSAYTQTGSLATTGETSPTGLWFKPDGTKLFVVGSTQDRLRSWDLTTPWDISTATNLVAMAATLKNTAGVALTQPTGVSFSTDGTKCFITDGTANSLYRYTLSTAWNITTIGNADQVNSIIYAANATPQSIWVRPDGLMFLTANSGTTAQYRTWTSSVANDITALTAGTTLAGASTPIGVNFVDDGNRLIYLQQANDLLTIGSTGSAYNLSSITGTNTRTVTAQDTTPQDIYMKNDGTSFYYLGSAGDRIFQFNF